MSQFEYDGMSTTKSPVIKTMSRIGLWKLQEAIARGFMVRDLSVAETSRYGQECMGMLTIGM